VLACAKGMCCSSLEKDLTAEIFESHQVGDSELEAVFDLALGRAGSSC